jgi:hypothetical protein
MRMIVVLVGFAVALCKIVEKDDPVQRRRKVEAIYGNGCLFAAGGGRTQTSVVRSNYACLEKGSIFTVTEYLQNWPDS